MNLDMFEQLTTLFHPEYKYFYNSILDFFKTIKNYSDIPNIIFYGPPNPLKYSLVNSCLQILTDENILNFKNVTYKINTSTTKQIEKTIKQSDYHIIIVPTGNNSDRYLVQNIIKDYAKQLVLNFLCKYKIVLILNAHNLSTIAQASLRRTMEQFNYNCRFIMICDKPLLTPIQSRCFHIRVNIPSSFSLCKCLFDLSIKHKIFIPYKKLPEIVLQCNKNIHNMLWYLLYSKYNYNDEFIDDYQITINTLFLSLLNKNYDIYNINKIMDIYYNFTITGFNVNDIITDLTLLFINNITDNILLCYNLINISINSLLLLQSCRRTHNIFRKFIIDIIYLLR